MFLSLRFCLYMTLNWYRIEHCRPSKASLYDVADRFRDFFKRWIIRECGSCKSNHALFEAIFNIHEE
jgi:hypothetical protein